MGAVQKLLDKAFGLEDIERDQNEKFLKLFDLKSTFGWKEYSSLLTKKQIAQILLNGGRVENLEEGLNEVESILSKNFFQINQIGGSGRRYYVVDSHLKNVREEQVYRFRKVSPNGYMD